MSHPYPSRLDQILAMDPAELRELIATDFNALVTLAVAAASRRPPPAHVRELLRSPEWCEDWHDALIYARGSLQTACERMEYEHDQRRVVSARRLRAVCRDLCAAGHLVRERHHDLNRSAHGKDTPWLRTPQQIAAAWLGRVHPEAFVQLLGQVRAERGVQEVPFAENSLQERIEYALARGWIREPVTGEVTALLAMSAALFTQEVARDVKEQERRSDGLRHPLVAFRWRATLEDLAARTAAHAHAVSVHELGPLRVDLRAMPPEEVERLFKTRRFFVAINQRLIEVRHWIRWWNIDAERGYERDPRRAEHREVVEEVRQRMAAQFEGDYRILLEALCPGGVALFGPDTTPQDYARVKNGALAEVRWRHDAVV